MHTCVMNILTWQNIYTWHAHVLEYIDMTCTRHDMHNILTWHAHWIYWHDMHTSACISCRDMQARHDTTRKDMPICKHDVCVQASTHCLHIIMQAVCACIACISLCKQCVLAYHYASSVCWHADTDTLLRQHTLASICPTLTSLFLHITHARTGS